MHKDNLIKRLQNKYRFIADEAVSYKAVSSFDLVIKTRDGRSVLYDDMEESFRYLPTDSYELSEEECRREFAMRLRAIMFRKGITQIELSTKTGIPQQSISNYVRGVVAPGLYNLDKIAKALKCSVDDFRYID